MSTGPLLRLTCIIAMWTLWVQMTGIAIASEKSPTAFIHANLITMTTATVLPDQTVVVEGNQIICHRSYQPNGNPAEFNRGELS